MTTSKPAIVIVPGACHPATYFEEVKLLFESHGYEVLMRTLPSVGTPGATLSDDRDAIAEMIEPAMDGGREYVVIGHSYGGNPAVGVCKGRGLRERAAAQKRGGIRAVIFVASVLVLEGGISPYTAVGSRYPPWLTFRDDKSGLLHVVKDLAKPVLYSDLDDATASRLVDGLLPHSSASLQSIQHYAAADLQTPAYYVVCEKDNTVPPGKQHAICDSGKIPGLRKLTMQTGHCPFLSDPKGFVELIDTCVTAEVGRRL